MSYLDLVWDRYLADTLKTTTRLKRGGKGVCRRVVDSAPLPSNWLSFLCEDLNKSELFNFLSKELLASFKQERGELVVRQSNDIHAVQHDYRQILVRTVDTDVVVLV